MMDITADLSDGVKQCVAFLAQDDDEGRRRPMASAFIVGVDLNDNGQYQTIARYIVTARHNLEHCKKDRPLFLRVNKDSGFEDIEFKVDDFIHHSSTDVAITHGSLPKDAIIGFVPFGMLLRSEMLSARHLKEGSPVAIPCLFSQFHGRQRIHPIIRTGRLALVPDERLIVTLGPRQKSEVEAYLIEATAWGGSSGAPVFVDYFNPAATSRDPYEVGTKRLLGLINGHYTIPHESVDDEQAISFNSGIAIVIPAQAIIDLILLPDLAEQRIEFTRQLGVQQE